MTTQVPDPTIPRRLLDHGEQIILVGLAEAAEPLLLYVLLEHQSTPRRWMRFRLLEYCCRIWAEVLDADEKRAELPPIVPVVFYQGERRWLHAREFAEQFAEAVREWPWTPRFEHLLVDQSRAAVGEVQGKALGRVAQLALMAAARRRRASLRRAALRLAAQYMGELARIGRNQKFGAVVRYVLTTQNKETAREFGEVLGRHVPGPGGDMRTYADELLEEGLRRGRQEGREEGQQEALRRGRQEGRQEGQLGTIERFLRAGIEWPVIEQATGIDRDTFQALRRRFESDPTTE